MGKEKDDIPRGGGLIKDVDEYNQKLWAKKKLKIRRMKNESKKIKKSYFKMKDGEGEPSVSSKQQEFYENLFKKDERDI